MEEVALGETLRSATPSAHLFLPWHLLTQPYDLHPNKAHSPKVPIVTSVCAIPSIHRMTADGFLNSVGRLGAVTGPLIRITHQVLPLLPPFSYGVIPIASSLILLFFVPETRGLPLPDTIQDLEKQ